uniref:Uncharacterized protein n=2 Tax=Aegilops tauschii TaxID=37682 RepID=A0A453AAS7_AEGTS|nr:uncharacterized protein LOC109746748 [Aegilops tauschii subsp. strangulata]
MASGAQKKMVAVGMMLAILFMAAANAEPAPAETCIDKTEKVGLVTDCICSKNCACAGKCILEGGDGGEIQKCFVECVLKNDCNCNAKHHSAAAPQ